ncbi:MAG TPA: hypothetical protein VME17_06590 [Bryobacteraceae bacterium]|nr:hypothetical protein [Bryobacteraceae bacterium]
MVSQTPAPVYGKESAHTNGTRPGVPTPRAMVADNDLALGRVVGS